MRTPPQPKDFENSFEDSVSDPRTWLRFSASQMGAARAIDKACKKAQRELQAFIEKAGGFENLPRSAFLRVERVMMRPAATYLAALSIENQLKGCLIEKNPELFRDKKVWEQFTSHSLASLGEEAGIKLSKAERHLLDELTSVLIWSGRYPGAKKKELAKWSWIAEAGAWAGPYLPRWKPLDEIEALRERLWMLYREKKTTLPTLSAGERRPLPRSRQMRSL